MQGCRWAFAAGGQMSLARVVRVVRVISYCPSGIYIVCNPAGTIEIHPDHPDQAVRNSDLAWDRLELPKATVRNWKPTNNSAPPRTVTGLGGVEMSAASRERPQFVQNSQACVGVIRSLATYNCLYTAGVVNQKCSNKRRN